MSKKRRDQRKAEAGRERARKSREQDSPGRIFRDGRLLTRKQSTEQLKKEAAWKATRDLAPWTSPAHRAALAEAAPEIAAEESIVEESAESTSGAQEEAPAEEPVKEKTETIAERLKRIRGA